MSTLSLVSGGIDSLLMCEILRRNGENQKTLFIDYGQLSVDKEWEACNNILKSSNLPIPNRVNLSGYGNFVSSGITDSSKSIRDAYLPGRNLMFLLIGSAYAISNNIDKVSIGLILPKIHPFPDQTENFIDKANNIINDCLNIDVKIITPLIKFSKKEVIRLVQNYNLPIEKTYSCYSGKLPYCGECDNCKELINCLGAENLPQMRVFHG